jgi:hypothetical protein
MNFFDPIQQQALVAQLRHKLEILKIQIAVLEELKREGVAVDTTEECWLAAVVEAKIVALEQRYTTTH